MTVAKAAAAMVVTVWVGQAIKGRCVGETARRAEKIAESE